MHQVYDQITAAVSIPFPHIADATAAAISTARVSRMSRLPPALAVADTGQLGRLGAHQVASPRRCPAAARYG